MLALSLWFNRLVLNGWLNHKTYYLYTRITYLLLKGFKSCETLPLPPHKWPVVGISNKISPLPLIWSPKPPKSGANIILLQELFETPYFCQVHEFDYFKLATTVADNAAINHFKQLAKELEVVLPISFYEKSGNTFFNSVTVIDADGEILGTYRKTHIPDGIPYAEKFYFTPGDTGFKVWDTKYAKIGVGICWDQWFPECARSMALMGAELLFYPTAIGDEPTLGINSKGHWQRCMQGHAAANLMPVIASNRIGTETISQNGQ